MQRKAFFSIGDKRITISALILVVFGSLMVASAEMGNSAGDTSYLSGVIIRQIIYAIVGIIAYFFLINFRYYKMRMYLFWMGYLIILGALISCRFFGQINGAYAWIFLPGGATIQPSEFAKVFMMAFGAKLIGINRHEKNLQDFKTFAICAAIYFVIIAVYQHDFGSAIVLFVICYVMMLIPGYKELSKIQFWMFVAMIAGLSGAMILMSEPFTNLLKQHADDYRVGRFLAAADPFLYQYDNGYHLIMSMVSFANGGLFGLGYGNSIHKYMNFPNPSNDFILPVIVEEFGIVGFLILLICYGFMLFPIIKDSISTKRMFSKVVLIGVFTYFAAHFILNVGGVSGIIPLTGVPLLMISSGGSSLVASMCALGIGQCELKRDWEIENESNSR